MAQKPKLKVTIVEKDFGLNYIREVAKQLRKQPYVKGGVTQARGSRIQEGSTKTVAFVAAVHEYGDPSRHIPERSFLRSTQAKNQEKYNQMIEAFADRIFDVSANFPIRKALGLIGLKFASDVKNTIREKIAPPLEESTIRSKNARLISNAKGTIESLRSKEKRTQGETGRLVKAANLVQSGGDSTPLIDTGQLINAVSYEVVMDGNSESGEEGGETE